ncbi:DTW domain-containing protein, partial [Tanacetum coccineum]
YGLEILINALQCWLPLEDCMCSSVVPSSLWHRIRFWLYMHPKDFLRQNNTGKLLWQVFGIDAATLCLFGIAEHEEIMWEAFTQSGRNNVWCLYPNKNAPTKSVADSFAGYTSNNLLSEQHTIDRCETLNFILIDGTWSNSAAMFRRLKVKAYAISIHHLLSFFILKGGKGLGNGLKRVQV